MLKLPLHIVLLEANLYKLGETVVCSQHRTALIIIIYLHLPARINGVQCKKCRVTECSDTFRHVWHPISVMFGQHVPFTVTNAKLDGNFCFGTNTVDAFHLVYAGSVKLS